MKRRVLTILVGDTVEQPQWALMPKSMALLELLGHLMTAAARGEAGPSRWQPRDFLLFDWSGRRLPADVRVGEVPLPGIVIAAIPGSRTQSLADSTGVWMFRQALLREDRSRDILWRFLSSPDAAVVSANVREIDVFVSYSFEDGPLASTVVQALESRNFQVFLAESSLSTGRQWRAQVREAVRSSRSGVLLLTPASIKSTWVLAEAGALANQGTPMIVLHDGVKASEIPKPLQDAVAIEPADQSDKWLDIVARRVSPEATRV
jgi:hypothetical protein